MIKLSCRKLHFNKISKLLREVDVRIKFIVVLYLILFILNVDHLLSSHCSFLAFNIFIGTFSFILFNNKIPKLLKEIPNLLLFNNKIPKLPKEIPILLGEIPKLLLFNNKISKLLREVDVRVKLIVVLYLSLFISNVDYFLSSLYSFLAFNIFIGTFSLILFNNKIPKLLREICKLLRKKDVRIQFIVYLYFGLFTLLVYYLVFFSYSHAPLTIYVGTFFLILFNIILESPSKSDDLEMSSKIKSRSIITLFLTFCFVIYSIYNFVSSLDGYIASGETFASYFSLSGNLFYHIDVLLFFGVILLTFYLLRKYSLLPYGTVWETVFKCLISFFAAIILSYIALDGLSLEIDPNTSKSVISTVLQIEVTVSVLIFTLSIVIIQQIASSYLPAIGKLFTNSRTNPIFIITICLYLASVLIGVYLLNPIPDIPPKDLKYTLFIFILFSSFAFLLTIYPFMRNVFNFIMPKNVLKLLNTNRKCDISPIEDENCIHLLSVLLNSLEKYDYGTVKECLNYFEDYKSELLNPHKNNIVPRELDNYLVLEESLFCLANHFINIGELSLKAGYNDCTTKIIKDLHDIKEVADVHKMESVTSITTKSIGELAKEVVYPLINELNGNNPDNYKFAIFALGEVGDERALSPIVKLLQNGDYTVIPALGKIKPENTIMFLHEVVKIKTSNISELINNVFSAFRENDLLTKELLTVLLKDDNPYLRGFAALGLEEIGDEGDIGTLSRLLLGTEQPSYVRGKAARAIGTIHDRYHLDEYVTHKLVEKLDDPDPYVKYNVVYSLSKIRIEDPRIISKIEDLLTNYDHYIRDVAVFALKEGRYPCSFESLNNALKTEKEEDICFNIILALGFIKGFDKIGPLLSVYFPRMSLPLYTLVCNFYLWDQEQSSILPLYVATFCTKSKYYVYNFQSNVLKNL